MTITSFEAFKELARRGTFVPVVKEIVADLLTPVSAFLKIAEDADYAFLLESVEGGEHVGRYSFLGKDPFLILRARGERTTIDRGGVVTEKRSAPGRHLADVDGRLQIAIRPELPRFTGGAVGYLGYGAASWFEPVLGDLGSAADGADDAGFMLFDTVLAFDHVQHRSCSSPTRGFSRTMILNRSINSPVRRFSSSRRELERNLSHSKAERSAGVEMRSNHTREQFERRSARPSRISRPATSIRWCSRSGSKPR